MELVNLAEQWHELLASGKVPNRAAIAREFRCTRARVTQIMKLLDLHPEVLAYIRRLPAGTPTKRVTERGLRPLMALPIDEQPEAAPRVLSGFGDDIFTA